MVIVNNAPDDMCPFAAELRSNERLVTEDTPGSYAARNHGLSIARGEVLAFTDADCMPDPDWLRNAVSALDACPCASRVTGPVDVFRVSGKTSWLAWQVESVTAFNQEYSAREGLSVTANLIVRREVFDQIGTFDANYYSGGDMEWNARATLAGSHMVYREDVRVAHPARSSLRAVVRKHRRKTGARFERAREEGRVAVLVINLLFPPARAVTRNVARGKRLLSALVALLVLWTVKIAMVPEVVRLYFSGEPER